LPSDGNTIYGTLYSLISGIWQKNQTSYTAYGHEDGDHQPSVRHDHHRRHSAVQLDGLGGDALLAGDRDDGGREAAVFARNENNNLCHVTGLPIQPTTIYVTLHSQPAGGQLADHPGQLHDCSPK
jgi:hypothetical protein